MGYYCAHALMGGSSSITTCTEGLVGEINQKYPDRDHASDGWVGDTSHSARASDHNPDWNDGGIVRAVDIDSNGAPGVTTPLVRDVLAAAIGDPRVYYVIWNRKIYSRTYGWAARYYTGSNPHDHHVHVSLRSNYRENDESTWLEAPPFKVRPIRVSVSGVRDSWLDALKGRSVEPNNGIGRIQAVLNKRGDTDLTVDGVAGPKTRAAWAAMEKRRKTGTKHGRDDVPDRASLAVFARGRFGLVA